MENRALGELRFLQLVDVSREEAKVPEVLTNEAISTEHGFSSRMLAEAEKMMERELDRHDAHAINFDEYLGLGSAVNLRDEWMRRDEDDWEGSEEESGQQRLVQLQDVQATPIPNHILRERQRPLSRDDMITRPSTSTHGRSAKWRVDRSLFPPPIPSPASAFHSEYASTSHRLADNRHVLENAAAPLTFDALLALAKDAAVFLSQDGSDPTARGCEETLATVVDFLRESATTVEHTEYLAQMAKGLTAVVKGDDAATRERLRLKDELLADVLEIREQIAMLQFHSMQVDQFIRDHKKYVAFRDGMVDAWGEKTKEFDQYLEDTRFHERAKQLTFLSDSVIMSTFVAPLSNILDEARQRAFVRPNRVAWQRSFVDDGYQWILSKCSLVAALRAVKELAIDEHAARMVRKMRVVEGNSLCTVASCILTTHAASSSYQGVMLCASARLALGEHDSAHDDEWGMTLGRGAGLLAGSLT